MKTQSIDYLLTPRARETGAHRTPFAPLAARTLKAAARLSIEPRAAAVRVIKRKGKFCNV
ncbi:MAG: hypothetical protein ACI4QA_02485 [Candidatus Spyradosoma sp.]